jgi:hypothetical protein
MDLNPYESPREAISIPFSDALRGPALACQIVSVLAIAWSLIIFGEAVLVLATTPNQGFDAEGLFDLTVGGFLPASLWLIFGIAGIVVGKSIKRRRRRSLVILWSLASILSCFFSPVGIILLMRLRRPAIWSSFAPNEVQ